MMANGQDDSSTINVLIANMPGVLSEMLERIIQQQSDMHLIGKTQGHVQLLMAIQQDMIDVLLLGADHIHPLPGICTHLLAESPHTRIMVFSNSGDRAMCYWLGLRHRQMSAVSTQSLLKNIRQIYMLDVG